MVPLVTCVFVKDRKVLMEKRPEDDDIEPGEFHFPAGHIDEGETLEEAVNREMEEELGVEMKDYIYLKKLPYSSEDGDFMVHYFVCNNWKGKIRSKNEAGELVWLNLEDKHKFAFDKDIEIVDKVLTNYS